MMRVYDDIKAMMCDELEEIAKKKELTSSSLDVIDKAIDIVKDITTIKAMESEYPEHEGYSGYYPRPYYMYDDMGSSYARKRDSMGRYSRDTSNTMEELRRLMDNAKDEKEREALRKAMDGMR